MVNKYTDIEVVLYDKDIVELKNKWAIRDTFEKEKIRVTITLKKWGE